MQNRLCAQFQVFFLLFELENDLPSQTERGIKYASLL